MATKTMVVKTSLHNDYLIITPSLSTQLARTLIH